MGDGLTEHEFDHVVIGHSNNLPHINPDEVGDWKYMALPEIRQDMDQHPEKYTVWFQIAFDEVEEHLRK